MNPPIFLILLTPRVAGVGFRFLCSESLPDAELWIKRAKEGGNQFALAEKVEVDQESSTGSKRGSEEWLVLAFPDRFLSETDRTKGGRLLREYLVEEVPQLLNDPSVWKDAGANLVLVSDHLRNFLQGNILKQIELKIGPTDKVEKKSKVSTTLPQPPIRDTEKSEEDRRTHRLARLPFIIIIGLILTITLLVPWYFLRETTSNKGKPADDPITFDPKSSHSKKELESQLLSEYESLVAWWLENKDATIVSKPLQNRLDGSSDINTGEDVILFFVEPISKTDFNVDNAPPEVQKPMQNMYKLAEQWKAFDNQ